MIKSFTACLVVSSAVLLLNACSTSTYYPYGERDSGPDREVDISAVPNAIPKVEPKSRYGNPDSYVVFGKRYYTLDSSLNFSERGIASWYGNKFHGKRTSSGEPYDMYGMTAAHKSLPLPTYVEVTNIENGRKIIVKVNDRGPFHENRIIDLSYVAAAKLGIARKGTGLVEIRALQPGQTAQPGNLTSDNQTLKTAINNTSPDLQQSNSVLNISTTRISPHPRLFIQAGAFGNEDNARRLQLKLQNDLLQPVRIEQTQSAGKVLYRVQVGPVSSVEDSDRISLQLNGLGIEQIRTIIE